MTVSRQKTEDRVSCDQLLRTKAIYVESASLFRVKTLKSEKVDGSNFATRE
jgi:hypothetical protein